MKLILDTNIIFTYFWKGSITKRLIMNEDLDLEFFAPEFALEEIIKHKLDILEKTKISESEFEVLKFDLAISINFIPIEEYQDFLKYALEICPDSNDIDFFALALKLNLPIWTNDKLLKNQDKIKIINTKEILDYLNN